MATKNDLFVIAVISNDNTQYVGLDKQTASLKRVDNPAEIERCFTHEDAHKVKQLMKTTKDFLKEGESVRVKVLSQCMRDYVGRILKRGFEGINTADADTLAETIKSENLIGAVKEEEAPAESETPVEEETTPVEPETPKKKSKKAKTETPVEEVAA